jgi:membrane-associated phospholipid phosphatase
MYAPGLYPSDRVTAEGSFSFYSGHTSYAFAIATSFSYTFMLRHPRSKWSWAVWASTLTVATIEPILRVESGDHFPTDTIVAALVGTSFGVLIPALHRLKLPANLSISPTSAGANAGLSLHGAF